MTLAVVVKIAAAVLTDEKARKKVGWVIAAILSPIILIAAAFLCIGTGGAEHNASAVDASFFSSGIAAETVPLEFKSHVEDMTNSFVSIDAAVAQICQQMEGGDSLDAIRVKAVFYALFFGDSQPSTKNIAEFVNYFVTYETRTAEDGSTYTVAVPIADMATVYANIGAAFGMEVTDDDSKNADNIHARIRPAGDTHAGDVLRGDGDGVAMDTSAFTNPAGKNNLDLVIYAVNAYESGWGYVWGTFGSVLTESLYNSKLAQYPDGVGKYADFIKTNWLNKRTTDCVGLIKGYGWLDADSGSINYGTNGMPDVSADQMYNFATEKGSISTIPEIPGFAVWHAGHIGVYIGNGEVIEAMGTKYGVVKTQLADRSWTAWLKIPYINYISETEEAT